MIPNQDTGIPIEELLAMASDLDGGTPLLQLQPPTPLNIPQVSEDTESSEPDASEEARPADDSDDSSEDLDIPAAEQRAEATDEAALPEQPETAAELSLPEYQDGAVPLFSDIATDLADDASESSDGPSVSEETAEQTESTPTEDSSSGVDSFDQPDFQTADFPDFDVPAIDGPLDVDDSVEAPSADRVGFQGFIDKPAISQSELDRIDFADPTREIDERIERHFEIQQRASEDFIKQLSAELGPTFEEMKNYHANAVHDYVAQQQLIVSMMRVI